MDIQQIYKTLIDDQDIISLLQLSKVFGFGSKRRIKMTNELYHTYTKEHIESITRSRRASVAARKQWKTRSRVMSTEVKEKISHANKIVWANDDGPRREISRKNMIRNSKNVDKKKATQKAIQTRRKRDIWANYTPETYNSLVQKNKNKKISQETRIKQSISAKKRGRTLPAGYSPSATTRKKLSEATTNLWRSGKFKKIYVSKTSKKLIDNLKLLGYSVEPEYFISGRPFDMKINDRIIEFYGTYWHYDPRKYSSDFFDKFRKVTARDIWNRDKEKLLLAENNGFKTYVVWQSDWENNPSEVLKNVRKFIETT